MTYALVVILSLATLGVLIAGIVTMARGGKTNDGDAGDAKANGLLQNKLMTYRIYLQAAAVIVLVIAFSLAK